MTISTEDVERTPREIATTMHEHWRWFLAEGVLLMVLGAAAFVIPPIATLALTLLVGWLLVISGVAGFVTTSRMRSTPGFWWSFLSALIAFAAGVLLLVQPLNGILSLTFVLIAFFIIEGVASVMFALDHRNDVPGGWLWMLISGIVDILLGALIFAGLPGSAAWALGLLVGVNLLFGGAGLAAMALRARQI